MAHLQTDFNAMAEKLEISLADLKSERDKVAQVLQARRDLVASVSHKLLTPVATLRSAVEIVLTQPDAIPETIRPRLDMMENEIQRLSGLIDDLFTLSQVEVNNLRLECAPTKLTQLILQVVDACLLEFLAVVVAGRKVEGHISRHGVKIVGFENVGQADRRHERIIPMSHVFACLRHKGVIGYQPLGDTKIIPCEDAFFYTVR